MEQISGVRRRTVWVLAATTLLVAVMVPAVASAGYVSPLVAFLSKPGEIGEFEPGIPQIFRTVGAVRNASGARPTKPELRRYEAEEFVEAAIVRIHGKAEPAAKGMSSVFEFENPAGAHAEMKAEVRKENVPESRRIAKNPYLVLRRFTVPGVPGAVGFALVSNKAAEKRGLEAGIAKGLFVEGSCFFSIGVFRPSSKEVIERVIEGVQAISRRTAGVCP